MNNQPSTLCKKTIPVPCLIIVRPSVVLEADRKVGAARDKFLKMSQSKQESYLNRLADIRLEREMARLARTDG